MELLKLRDQESRSTEDIRLPSNSIQLALNVILNSAPDQLSPEALTGFPRIPPAKSIRNLHFSTALPNIKSGKLFN